MTKLNKLLFKILLASILLFAFSLVFSRKGKSEPKSLESALLNPKYKNEVNMIEIQTEEESGSNDFNMGNFSIKLKKHGDFWLLSKLSKEGNEETCTIADSKIINSLIENANKLRKIYKITEKETDYDSLGISENHGTTISFSQNRRKLYTKLHLGLSDSLKNRIYFRSETSKTVYETENDFEQYLTTDTNYWSEGEIFPEITKAVQITLETNEDSDVQITRRITLDEKSQNFASKSHSLLSLRHGKIISENQFQNESKDEKSSSRKVSTLTLEDGNGRIARIDFFEKRESETTYFYKKSVTPSQIDTQETSFAFYSENAVYEISPWTYEKIKSVFTQEN